jgi:phosphohistidine phosphatase SixA
MNSLFTLARRSVVAVALVAVCAAPSTGQPADGAARRPRQVLLIRHAEKPADDDASVHLSPDGVKRAEALHRLFESAVDRSAPFPTPDVIFAARDSKHSHRSGETVAPLAKRLKLTVNANYKDEEFAAAAHEVLHNPKYAGKTVLVCWHHGMMPQLAAGLGAADAPDHWKGSVFDRVWQITYGQGGKASIRDRPQQLLPGDAAR